MTTPACPSVPRLIAWAGASCLAGVVQAAPLADLPLEELMRIEVVSAARKSQRLADVAASMHVITAEDLRSSGVRDLPEALRLVPGMDVTQLSASRWGISTRGFTGRYANKLLVLIDGRSAYSPMFSGVLWEAERVPLDTIERIEVMHGPAGAIWGSNAVNGVINIITRSASETQGGLVDAAAGDGGRVALRVRQGGQGETGAWRLGAATDRGDSGRGDDGSDANDDFRHAMVDARWDRTWNADARSSLEAKLVRSDSNELQGGNLYVPPYGAPVPVPLRVDRLVLGLRHEDRWSDALTVSLGLSISDERLRLGERVHARPRIVAAEASTVWRVAASHELSLGGSLRHLDLPATTTDWIDFDPAQRRGVEWGAYAQDEWTLEPGRWRVVGGVRVDHDLYSGSHAQPNLRLLFTPRKELALWAGASRASRAPARGEEDGIIQLGVLPPGTPQNPGPLPVQLLGGNGQPGSRDAVRRLDALELGLRMQALAGLSLDAALFHHRLRDDIGSTRPGGAPIVVATPQPHLELAMLSQPYDLRLRGFEAAADWRPAAGWRHLVGVSHLRCSVPADAAATGLDRQIHATPRWLAHWRSVIDVAADWRLDARLRHMGRRGAPADASQHVDASTALDATLTWRRSDTTELSVGATNLLRPAQVEFSPDFGIASATEVPRRFFLRWRQAF